MDKLPRGDLRPINRILTNIVGPTFKNHVLRTPVIRSFGDVLAHGSFTSALWGQFTRCSPYSLVCLFAGMLQAHEIVYPVYYKCLFAPVCPLNSTKIFVLKNY